MLQAYTPPNDLAAQAARFDLSHDELGHVARKAAKAVQQKVALWEASGASPAAIHKEARRLAKRHHVELPGTTMLESTLNRLSDAAWWRRALKKRLRVVEHQAIREGAVHRDASAYVSERALRRARVDSRRTAELLASMDAINQATGEVLPLEALIEKSLANPSNRRRAMMARISGIERHAASKGHVGLFLTITCPSRMHAASGVRSTPYDGCSPRQAQAHLHRVWRRAMRKLQHDGIAACGMRVTEPHQDACPHWHVLVFCAPHQVDQLTQTFRGYALSDSPNEPGAAERRFVVERVDPTKGSAAGYVAKYIAKSIDGEGVDTDDETGHSGSDAALRVVTWARLWAFRQFQFFGVPSVTPTRELYRLAEGDSLLSSESLQQAHQASKANDYGAWLSACEAYALRFRIGYVERPSTRYSGEVTRRITGVTACACDLASTLHLTTRTDEWRIEVRGKTADNAAGAGVPWTRFTNCAPVDFIEVFGADDEGPIEGPAASRRSRAGPPGQSPPPRAQHPRGGAAC